MNKNIVAVILAAGRGSRMKGFTDDKPKCLLTLAGKRLLDWQVESLNKAGLHSILVVRGYLADRLQGSFATVENTRWAKTNMVSSLLVAFEKVQESTVLVSYSDIVYSSEHVKKLLAAQGDICMTYDTQWESLWRLRNENPLDDAETFKQKDNVLVEIGQKTKDINDIQGQYMGLLKFSPTGQKLVKEYIATLEPHQVDALDMTSLLQALLQRSIVIHTVPVDAKWCECDTQEDILAYEDELEKNRQWAHNWM